MVFEFKTKHCNHMIKRFLSVILCFLFGAYDVMKNLRVSQLGEVCCLFALIRHDDYLANDKSMIERQICLLILFQ